MKQLILGIDGGDERIFKAFDMPFLHSLISDNSSVNLSEDLFSRGWAEIISGRHARSHKGFYILPKLDGTPDFTLGFSFDKLKETQQSPFIWEFAENQGMSVGVMNIPTTFPSPKGVDGFFVSGAGGGLYKVDGIPKEMCSDEETRTYLEKRNYVLELRFGPSDIKDLEFFFSEMAEMMEKRFDVFTELCVSKKCEFGFLALRASANLLYLVMYQVDALMNNQEIEARTKQLLNDHFALLDSLIEKLFIKFQPKNFIITADHGMAPQKYHVNYNVFLEKNGYQVRKGAFLKENLKRLKNILKKGLNLVGQNHIQTILTDIDWAETKIFGTWYSNVLYVNDSRFKGMVKDDEVPGLVASFINKFNSSPEAKKFGMKAIEYREQYMDNLNSDLFPDIFIQAPDNMFFKGNSKEFVCESPWFKEFSSLKHVPTSMFTGTKGKSPICVMNRELAELINENDEKDLTLVYKLTKRLFEGI